MNNEVTAGITILSQSIMIVGNLTKATLRFIILCDRHFRPFLEQRLNAGKQKQYGVVNLKTLESLRGKNLAIIPMSEEMVQDLKKECRKLNIVYCAKKEVDKDLQNKIAEKKRELVTADESIKNVLSKELKELKAKERYTVFLDSLDIKKMKYFLEKYSINLNPNQEVVPGTEVNKKNADINEITFKALSEALEEQNSTFYQEIGISEENIEKLRQEPITESQAHVLSEEPSILSEGYIRNKERINNFNPRNKLEAIEVIGYLYGRTNTMPSCPKYEVQQVQQDSDGDGFSDAEEFMGGSNPYDFKDNPLMKKYEQQLQTLEQITVFENNAERFQIQSAIREMKTIFENKDIEKLKSYQETFDKIFNKVLKHQPKLKM